MKLLAWKGAVWKGRQNCMSWVTSQSLSSWWSWELTCFPFCSQHQCSL